VRAREREKEKAEEKEIEIELNECCSRLCNSPLLQRSCEGGRAKLMTCACVFVCVCLLGLSSGPKTSCNGPETSSSGQQQRGASKWKG